MRSIGPAVTREQSPVPYVRKAASLTGPKGDIITKFDLRFLQPNTDSLPTGAMHTLEHLLSVYLREELDNVVDLSPMGCRTGFYLIMLADLGSVHGPA